MSPRTDRTRSSLPNPKAPRAVLRAAGAQQTKQGSESALDPTVKGVACGAQEDKSPVFCLGLASTCSTGFQPAGGLALHRTSDIFPFSSLLAMPSMTVRNAASNGSSPTFSGSNKPSIDNIVSP